LETGRTWLAVQSAGRAIALAPNWPTGHVTLGRAQLNLGEPELALTSMEHAAALLPEGEDLDTAEVDAVRSLVQQRKRIAAVGSGDATAGRMKVVNAAPE
jgi:hypothetical protein